MEARPAQASGDTQITPEREQLRKSLWSPERALKYMKCFGIIKGCNYVPAYAHSHPHMREGETYKFRGMLKGDGRPLGVEIRFYPTGSWDKPIATIPLHGISTHYHEKRFAFKNEVDRWFKPEEYARACVVYSQAMKAVDPTIKVGMVTYGRPLSQNLDKMLEIAGPHIDFFADRGDAEKRLDFMLGIMRDYNAQHGTSIKGDIRAVVKCYGALLLGGR